MTGRTTSFLVGVVVAGFAGALAIADQPSDAAGAASDPRIASTNQAEVCASDGLPGSAYSRAHRVVKRPGRAGYEHDHIVPLCLGGADTDANLQWQPIDEALQKDKIERAVCIAVCRHHSMTLSEGQAIFLGDWRRGLWRVR